jgi:hypothetical protein
MSTMDSAVIVDEHFGKQNGFVTRSFLARSKLVNTKKRNVPYERSLLTYIDVLGFREIIRTKTPNDISRSIRIVRESVQPNRFKTAIPDLREDEYINFSDLSIIWTPLTPNGGLLRPGCVHSQILRLVHAQASPLFDEGILLRGGITVGDVARSYGQLFGPAVVRGYDLENKVARFPRIVVGEEVFDELATNPNLWVHDKETDTKELQSLLHKDFDGEWFVDYLRVIKEELDDRSEYPSHLKRHEEFIEQGLADHRQSPSILAKFKWLREYHNRTAKRWLARERQVG